MKRSILSVLTCGSCIALSGCVSTSFRSMGSLPTPIVHQARSAPDSKQAEFQLSVDGVGLLHESWFNTDQIYGGGGIVGGSFHFGGIASPLFISTHVGGFGGKLNFACDKKENCADDYSYWLSNGGDEKSHSFWALQEQLTVGAEFHPFNVFLGFGGGMRAFQGGGDFDDRRSELEDNQMHVKNYDDGYGFSPVVSLWLGSYIGQNGKYGGLSFQFDWTKEDINDEANTTYIPITFSYFHPTGFRGGVTLASLKGAEVFIGKTFSC